MSSDYACLHRLSPFMQKSPDFKSGDWADGTCHFPHQRASGFSSWSFTSAPWWSARSHPLSVFRQKEACCEKQEALPATAAPRQGTAQPFVSLLYGGTFAAPPFLSASIVSADAHHGKCANENLPKSEYGSLLKGCRRSTNWNLNFYKLWPLNRGYRLSIKSSKSLGNKGFFAVCSPYPFIRFHYCLCFPRDLIREKSREEKTRNTI